MWKIKNIYEADFGCEERQQGTKLKVLVVKMGFDFDILQEEK